MKKTVEIDVNASQGIQALQKFGLTAEKLEEEDLQPLNFAIGELEDRLYEMASAGQQNTQEFKEMSAEVGKMKKVIIDTDLAVDGMSQTMAQKVGGSLGGITAGFELATGTMGAFGVDSEKVEEALLRVQSAMAISQGLQGIKESISSFRALGMLIKQTTAFQWLLNVAMNANPIGLIIAGVAAVGAAIYALWSPIKKLRDYFLGMSDNLVAVEGELMDVVAASEKLTKILERNNKALDKLIEASRKRGRQALELLEAEGASDEEIHKQKLKNLKDEETFRKASLQAAQTSYASEKKMYNKLVQQGKNEEAKALKEKLQGYKDNIEELKAADGDYYHNKKILDEEEKDRQEQTRKENYEKYKSHLESKLQLDREIEDRRLGLRFDNEAKEVEANRIKYERELAEIKKRTGISEKQRAELIEIATAEAGQRHRDIVTKWENETNTLKIDSAVKTENTIVDYKESSELKQRRLARETAAEQKALNLEVQNAKLDAASATFGAMGELATAFAADSEAGAKRAFNINKAAQMAQAIISTYQGATAIFASAAANPKTVLFPAQPFIMAGAAIAGGLANVATIARTQFGGGGGGASSGGGARIPTTTSSPANFNVVGNTGTNQLAETLGSQPLKAYVVAQDVTTQQSLDRNKIETASL